MSSALLAVLFAILGTGLAVTSTACFLLWRRVRALTSATLAQSGSRRDSLTRIAVEEPSSPEVVKRPTRARYEVARRIDDLSGRHRALEARLARIEASTTEAAITMASLPRGPRLGQRSDSGHDSTADGPTLISVPNLASPPAPTSEAAAEFDRRFGPVWAMADDGRSTEAIARETGYPIGQVELILGLRRQLLVSETGARAGSDD